MSDKFVSFQKLLRRIADEHDIDMAHSRGVVINDHYHPAIGKSATIDNNFEDESAGFWVPFENGLRANVNIEHTTKQPYVSMHLQVPKINLQDGETVYNYGTATHVGDDAYFHILKHPHAPSITTRAKPHELLEEWSQLPYQGTIDWWDDVGYTHFTDRRRKYKTSKNLSWYDLDRKDLALTKEELAEHRKNYRMDPNNLSDLAPMHIQYNFRDVPNTAPLRLETYLYHVDSESMKPWS